MYIFNDIIDVILFYLILRRLIGLFELHRINKINCFLRGMTEISRMKYL